MPPPTARIAAQSVTPFLWCADVHRARCRNLFRKIHDNLATILSDSIAY
jgi:hypothetical protein